VHYRPGWDCHGLPIEVKVLQKAGENGVKLGPLEIRRRARLVAEETMKDQRQSFKDWGVAADWEKPYLTMDVSSVKRHMRAFKELHEKGFVFRRLVTLKHTF